VIRYVSLKRAVRSESPRQGSHLIAFVPFHYRKLTSRKRLIMEKLIFLRLLRSRLVSQAAGLSAIGFIFLIKTQD
jgi:hypothetical protein